MCEILEFKFDIDTIPINIVSYCAFYDYIGLLPELEKRDGQLKLKSVYCTELTDDSIREKLSNNLSKVPYKIALRYRHTGKLPKTVMYRKNPRRLSRREDIALRNDYIQWSPAWRKELTGLKHYTIYLDTTQRNENEISRYTQTKNKNYLNEVFTKNRNRL